MTFSKYLIMALASTAMAISLSACGNTVSEPVKAAQVDVQAANAAKLDTILAAGADTAKARYDARNPKDTLLFLGIEPGMTVVDVLPGGGWYTKILLPYLGEEGGVIATDYSLDMWPEFGGFATPEFVEKKKTWPETWSASAAEWRSEGDAPIVSAFAFGNRDGSLDGTADAVLFIRAMHNLFRFQENGDYLQVALKDVHALLKTGGIVGIVQHAARDDRDEAWANGSNGYLKKSAVIAAFEAAGFELTGESDINVNPLDQASIGDDVWRLPPTLGGSRDNPELRAKMEAIGESNRMTLKFKKL